MSRLQMKWIMNDFKLLKFARVNVHQIFQATAAHKRESKRDIILGPTKNTGLN